MKLLIIADDFTGALDTGVQFAAKGASTRVVVDCGISFANMPQELQVLIVDAETRHLPANEAYHIVYNVVKKALEAGFTHIYKKTDSALRGNVGSELAAVMKAAGADRMAFIPALPCMNRITRAGIQYIDGVPVADSVFGQDPFEPVTESRVDAIVAEKTDLPAVLHARNEPVEMKARGIHIYDAETQADLNRLGNELGADGWKLCAGCAGFAAVIAKLLLPDGHAPALPRLKPGLFVVCGSVNPVTLRQLCEAEKSGFTHIHLNPAQKLESDWVQGPQRQAFVEKWLALAKEGRCILDVNDPPGCDCTAKYAALHGMNTEYMRRQISTNLAILTKAILDEGLQSTILCTGGDTLLALMKQVKVGQMIPVGELAPGAVLTQFCYNGHLYDIISKSGGFGAPDLLIKIREEITMLKQYNLKMPHAVYGGENALDSIATIVKTLNAKKVAMFTDKSLRSLGLFDMAEEVVKATGTEYYVLDELPSEPSYMAVQAVVDQFKRSGADLIVACGGGSVMDAAKLASILVTDEYGVKELLDDPGMAKKCVPIVLIPTTAGTGAEVTPNAIVGVPERELKIGIVNDNMIADFVILDARLIKNLPRKIAAATGVDAMAHCIECFTSNKANIFSDMYALEGLDLILNHIEKACDDSTAMAEKNRMQIAAYYGGLAITASGTTAVHALSYPLGGKYHIAHGVSNAILLAPVMRFNAEDPAFRERLALVYDHCCHDNVKCETVDEKAAWLIARMEAIVKHLDIPTSLKEFGIAAKDLDGLVEAGMQVQRLLVNNMRTLTAEDARKLYLEIM